MTRIVSLAARGDGLGEDGGYYPLTAPDDVILVDGRIEQGSHHIEPVCRHFGTCGGCQLQHVDDAAYAKFLTDRIAGALAGQGVISPSFAAPHMSPTHARRRVSFAAEQTKGGVHIGFNEAGSHRLVDLAACPVMHPSLFALLKPLRSLLVSLLPSRRRVSVRMTVVDQGIDMLLDGIEVDGLAATETIGAFAKRHGLARISIDEGFGPTAWWEPEPVTISLGGVPVPMPESAFLQATKDGETALVECVRSFIGESEAPVDLFSGLGTFALSIAGRVHAVEGTRDAVLALQAAANIAGKPITTEHRDLFRRPVSASDLAKFDAVILDPPRAGAKEQIAELAASRVPIIAYVSCNPSTFARDAKSLIDGGYRLEAIKPVGQFRWSTHVELASLFRR
jgi:23S rRNA (uracil1939-C5)-methyltransferase